MSENIQSTQNHLDKIFDEVRRYIPGVAKRLAFNYLLLIGVAVIFTLTIVPLLMRYIPISTARTIGFAVNFIWLFYGWRTLEQRNQATGLYTLYTRFSRARRDLEAVLKQKAKTEDVSPLMEAVELTASAFIDAAEEANIEPQTAAQQ